MHDVIHFVTVINPAARSGAPWGQEAAKAPRRPAALAPLAAKVLAQLSEMNMHGPHPRPKARVRKPTTGS